LLKFLEIPFINLAKLFIVLFSYNQSGYHKWNYGINNKNQNCI
jgi:hypothetical protein